MDRYDRLWYYYDMERYFAFDIALTALSVGNNGDVRCPASWTWTIGRETPFTNLDLWVVKNGTGILKTNGITYRLGAGDLFLFGPGDDVRASTYENPEPLEVCYVHFRVASMQSLRQFLPRYRRLSDPLVIRLLEQVVGASIAGRKAESEAYLTSVLYLLSRDRRSEGDRMSVGTPLAYPIEQICRELRQTPERTHRLSAYARRYNVSYEHLGKVFKAVTGISFTEYQNEARLAKADFLLSSSNYTIGEIADLLGFCDNSYFSKYYRKHRGVSPSQVRGT